MSRQSWARLVWAVTGAWLLVMLVSLRFGWLDGFFFDMSHAHVQGIDFFPIGRAWRNLLDGHSAFDTFRVDYGPRATWFLYHPAAGLLLGALTMGMAPWTAYGVWSVISAGLMMVAAWLVTRRGSDPLRNALAGLLIVGGFPNLIMLYVGNVQAVLVLATVLVLVAVDKMRETGRTRAGEALLLTGLLLSLFTKPAVLAMLPLLLLLQPTRRSAFRAVAIYAVVSLLFLVVPGFNPEPIPFAERWSLLTHPAVVRATMNVYTNGMVVTAAMKDNFVHWLVMRGLVDFRLNHIDVYSLPVFLDGLLGWATPDALYRVPALLVLVATVLAGLLRDERDRMEAALMVLMGASLLVFLSYGLVWEYHYTGVLPLGALLLVRKRLHRVEWAVVALTAVVWLPSVFFLLDVQTVTAAQLTLLRSTRVVPAVLIFCLLLFRGVRIALRSPAGLRLRSVGANGLSTTQPHA